MRGGHQQHSRSERTERRTHCAGHLVDDLEATLVVLGLLEEARVEHLADLEEDLEVRGDRVGRRGGHRGQCGRIMRRRRQKILKSRFYTM